uniref:SUMO1/sentrin/SMT3 specific peptidase 2 n=1 Tax=Nothobranchius kuhntae TaxID=321403 RepID=A0A1A8IF27_NOTKU
MYGWIVDGISSLFEPVSGQNSTEWSGERNDSEKEPTLPDVTTASRLQESGSRPVKRNYQSVFVADNVCQSDPVEVKRPRRDVVISFVKKTVTGLAGLLRLRKKRDNAMEHKETQPVALIGIDELHTSWISCADWRMDKSVVNNKGGKNPFQSSQPPLLRKHSGTVLPAGLSDREKRGSLQLLPSRPAVRGGGAHPELACSGFGHNRCYKPSLTVEEAIKQNNKEHYRRLLEMVTEKYSKNQPLPFHQTKPKEESLAHAAHRTSASEKTFESVSRRAGCTTAPTMFPYRNSSATKDRWGGLTLRGTFDDPQSARCSKQKQTAEVDLSREVATRLNLVDRDMSAAVFPEGQPTYVSHTRHGGEDVPRLTKEMAAEISEALAQSDPSLVLSAAFKLRITQRDLATLQEGGWLNDEVINFYLSLIMERSSGKAGQLKVYSFSTFFFPKLRGGGQPGGHTAVKRWTKAVDIFVFDLILVPLHLGVHWAMAIIDFKSKTVKSFDSMGQRHDDICRLLLLYLKEEHRVKKGKELDSTKWTVGSLKAGEIPQQRNGNDCGVFACKYADYIAKARPLTFKQCHMPLFRKVMMWEILNQKLL